VLLGIPVLILMLASIALTGYLAVDLISQGLREGQVSPLILGSLLAATWILMFYKTAKARLAPATGQ
jgi:hypothetical protein